MVVYLNLFLQICTLQVNFFMSYVFTSGWTSLACELVQLFPLIGNFFFKKILRRKTSPFDGGYTFPYHTELPRILLFGLFGFNFAVLAPLILPLLLIYFSFAYLIYRNQVRFCWTVHCIQISALNDPFRDLPWSSLVIFKMEFTCAFIMP